MPAFSPALLALLFTASIAHAGYPVLTSSFTWNQNCGPTVACGPSAAGSYGIGFAAANNVTYAAGKPIVGGVGAGCGQCWHLQPMSDVYTSNGLRLGTPVVVKINDQCTDPGYCDQEEGSDTANVNTRFGKDVHFDLCNSSGVTNQFFGQIGAGVAIGYAQQLPDCSALEIGPFGSKLGELQGGSANAGGVSNVLSAQAASPSDSLNELEGERMGVAVGDQSSSSVVMVSSSVVPSMSSTSVAVAAQSTTLVPVVSGSAPASIGVASPSLSSSSITQSNVPTQSEGDNDDQDDCDEL